MRVQRLDLIAFGPFSNGRIDFSKKERALQLIYGPNEAGKSTTLRALIALLYGIPLRSEDAHTHETARLRVGASFADERGRIVQVVRRKGLKNTLLDAAGEPLADAVMTELLHGVDENMFRNMFGLDHERLRAGAEALLAGAGQVGEGLLGASLGTGALRELKLGLSAEADALYKPRGKTPRLNLVLESLREKLKRKREDALSPSTFSEQTKALSTGQRERAQLLSQRHALLTERAELSRKLDFLAPLARHTLLAQELLRLSAQGEGEAGAALPEGLLRDLERRYGVALSAEAELPAASLELARIEEELALLRTRLGESAFAAKPMDTPQRTRLRRMAEEENARTRRLLELRASSAALRAQQAELCASVPTPGAAEELAADAAFLESVERENVMAARTRAEEEFTRRATLVGRATQQLGLAREGQALDEALLARLASLALPDESALSELEQREQAFERDSERADEALKQLEAQRSALQRARAELLVDGELATVEDLAVARAQRDEALSALLTAPAPAAVAHYRGQVAESDALADRLRRELSLSHELSRLEREEAARAEAEQALQHERAALTGRGVELRAEVVRVLSVLGAARARARGLRARLGKLELLREAAGAALVDLALLSGLRARASELALALVRRLSLPSEQTFELSELCALLRARVLTARAAEEEQNRREHELSDLATRLRQHAAELALLEDAERAGRAQLSQELAACGFGADLGHAEVLACLDDLSQRHDREQKRAALLARKQATESQAAQLREDVARAVDRFVPKAGALPISEQLSALARSERGAREASRDEKRVREELASLERELGALGDGASPAELTARVSGLDPNAARARLFEIDAALALLEEELGALDQRLGGLKAGMSRLYDAPFAVEVAEDAEAELGEARALLRRYVEVKLSLLVLSREVERHRQKHQDPLLARASLLFSRLTLGRYNGLSAELDERDEPVLCALHKSGKVVRVAGLSDGTRDQLYLALRVASIERFCGEGSRLPLVLDDAFIHFDDARAEAALKVLGELCDKTQVLFFTHHARMIELAKRALKSSQLAVHELDPVRGTVAFRDNGPLFADA